MNIITRYYKNRGRINLACIVGKIEHLAVFYIIYSHTDRCPQVLVKIDFCVMNFLCLWSRGVVTRSQTTYCAQRIQVNGLSFWLICNSNNYIQVGTLYLQCTHFLDTFSYISLGQNSKTFYNRKYTKKKKQINVIL